MLQTLKRTALAAGLVGLGLASSALGQTRLSGAGATFPQPFYERLVNAYGQVKSGVSVDYQGIGSGGGIKAITDKTVDFAGSDAPMNEKEIKGAGGEENLIMFPSTAGGVVPIYNLEGVDDLKLTGELIADIYMGKVSKWNDDAIKKLNPDAKLPNRAITPAWRTDGSGTTYVFTNYLSTQSSEFKQLIGNGKQVSWPFGQGGKGNPGVAAVVSQTPGSLGYVEEAYAEQNNISYAAVKNKSGKFVKATPESVSAAGAGAVGDMKGNLLTADIWDQKGDDAYPISTFTYLIVYKDLSNLDSKEKAQGLVDFLWWATHDGQQYAKELNYAPLAKPVLEKVESAMKELTYKGEKLKVGGGMGGM